MSASDPEASAASFRQTAERLRQMAAYGEVRLEDDPEDPGITRLHCLTAGAEEEE